MLVVDGLAFGATMVIVPVYVPGDDNWEGSAVTSISLGAAPLCGVTDSQLPAANGATARDNPTPGRDVILKCCVGAGAPVLCPLKLRLATDTCTAGGIASTSRMRLLPVSAIKRLPNPSTATAVGEKSWAATAGPPSPA